MTTHSKSATHFQWRPPLVHHVPRCHLHHLKNCWIALLGLGLGLGLALRLRLQLGLGSVLVYTVRVRLGSYGFELKLEGKHHHIFWWKTRLLGTHPLISFPHAIDVYVGGGRGSHYVHKGGKYDIKWSISSTMIMVCMFSSRSMMAHLVHWSLAWFDAYVYSRKKIMNL